MVGNDPKQAIIEHLSEPLGQIEPNPPPPPGIQLQGKPGISRKGEGLGAKKSTVKFLQERSLSDRQLHLVAFENETGQQQQWLLCVKSLTPDSWITAGGASIGGVETMPKNSNPWVNLAAGWQQDLFWAGGRVLDNGLDVVRVRLISENGIVLEDTVQDGLVMFVMNRWVQRPLQVELYNRSGNLVRAHQALKLHPLECADPS
jgi:hypothetical protein